MSKQFDYNSTVSNAVNRDDGSGEIDIMALVEPVAICLIVVGIILLIIAILGACGACCNSRLLLAVVSSTVIRLHAWRNKFQTKQTPPHFYPPSPSISMPSIPFPVPPSLLHILLISLPSPPTCPSSAGPGCNRWYNSSILFLFYFFVLVGDRH